MKNQIPELQALESDRFLLWVAILTLPLLSANCYYVYHDISILIYPYREIVSGGVALVIAGFILIYTVRKNYRMAKYYAYFEALISAYYYINTLGWSWKLIPALGFVLILPSSLFHSAREIKKPKPVEEPINEALEFGKKLHQAILEPEKPIDNDSRELIEALKDKVKILELKNADILLQGNKAFESLQKQLINVTKDTIDKNLKESFDLDKKNTENNTTVVFPAKVSPDIFKNETLKEEIEGGDYLNELSKKQEPTPEVKPAHQTHFWYQEGKKE